MFIIISNINLNHEIIKTLLAITLLNGLLVKAAAMR
jgi:hypothetical protein